MAILNLNIALIPTEKSIAELISVSNMISDQGETFFTLDGQNYHPHLTLFKVVIGDHRLNALTREVETVTKFNKLKDLPFTEANAGERGYIGLRTENLNRLLQLHFNLVMATHKLRREEVPWSNDRVSEMTSRQQANLRTYGYPYVHDCYNPHVTVTKLKDPSSVDRIAGLLEIGRPTPNILGVAGVGIFRSGEHGTCRELLRGFYFEQQSAVAMR